MTHPETTTPANPAQHRRGGGLRDVLDADKIATWPPLKKAIWDVVTFEQLNDGHYINAYDLTDKLHFAVTAANPAQGVIRQIVEDALNSAIPEPWEVAEHATQRILAAIGAGDEQPFHLVEEFDDVGAQMVVAPAIGAGGQPIDQELRDAAKSMGAEVARNVPMVGAGGQAVAVKPLKWERQSNGNLRALGAFGYRYIVYPRGGSFLLHHANSFTDDQFETEDKAKAAAQSDYESRVLSAISQPHPADERVVGALREAGCTTEDGTYVHAPMKEVVAALSGSGAAHPVQPGWRDMERAPKDGAKILYRNKFGGIGYCRWDEGYNEDEIACWWDSEEDDEVCPVAWLPADTLPAAPQPKGE